MCKFIGKNEYIKNNGIGIGENAICQTRYYENYGAADVVYSKKLKVL